MRELASRGQRESGGAAGFTQPNLSLFLHVCTVLVLRIAQRKWKDTKLQPGTAGPGNMLGCCLVYFHFLWAILSTSTVHGDSSALTLLRQSQFPFVSPCCATRFFLMPFKPPSVSAVVIVLFPPFKLVAKLPTLVCRNHHPDIWSSRRKWSPGAWIRAW